MGTVATLAVNVIARTGDFNKGLDKAGKKAKGFSNSVGASMKSFVTPAALATAGIAAVGVAVVKISSQLARLDQIAKKARGLGISGQNLMEFQHAAGLAGVEAESFTRAMMDMQKNIGDAIAGTGEAKDALALIGVEIADLARLSASDQFVAIADKIGEIENASERAAVAARVFGGAGADLIPMFVQGSAAIRKQMRELRELQGVISGFEFEQIEAANDAMTKLGKSWEGIWTQAAVEVAPILTDLVEILTEALKLVKSIGGVFAGYGKYLLPAYGLLLAMKDTWDWITDADTTKAAAQENVDIATKLLADTKSQHEAEMKAIEETAKASEALAKAREQLEAKGASLTESLRNPMEQFTDTIDNLNMMLGEGVISWKTYGRAVARAQDDIKKSDKFRAKEIKVAERQSVGAAIRGQAGTFSIQQKQQRSLEKIREEERLQTQQLKEQTSLLKQLNNNVKTGTVVTI
jgi:hypothetical protein